MKKVMVDKINVYQLFDDLFTLIKANGWSVRKVAKMAKPPVTDATLARIKRKKTAEIDTYNRLVEAYQTCLNERKEKTGR